MTDPALAPNAVRPQRSYAAIVWKQFKRDRLAVSGLCVIVSFFLVALAAPLLANNKPFVFHNAATGEKSYPLLREIFAPSPEISEKGLERAFNLVLVWGLIFLPLAWPLMRLTRNLNRSTRRSVRLGVALVVALAVIVPFLTVRSKLDKRDYVAEAEAFAPGNGSYAFFPLVRYNPFQQVEGRVYWAPCRAHPLGTDSIGRDILTRVIHGARVSLAVGFVAVVIYLAIGVFMGSMAGYHGGWVDIGVSRFIEVMMGFPTFLLILTIIAVFEARSVVYVMIIIGLTRWTGVARLMRGEVMKQRRMDYVSAARALGVRPRRIMFRHILPNAIAPVLVSATFGIAGTIMTESSLAFLGLGVRPPTATWGDLLRQSLANPVAYWWLMVFPGAIIFLSILSYNLAGEGLRDAIDPRLKK